MSKRSAGKRPGAPVIVLVDDEISTLSALTRLVEESGGVVVPFGGYHAARAFLESQAPDAMIVDVRLGEYNGLHLALFARQRYPSLPIVVMSGYDDEVLRIEAANAGAAYCSKPVDLQLLKRHLFAGPSTVTT